MPVRTSRLAGAIEVGSITTSWTTPIRPPCLKVPGVSVVPLSRLKGIHPGVAVGHRRNKSVVYVSFGSCPGLNGERLRQCLRRAAPPPITGR